MIQKTIKNYKEILFFTLIAALMGVVVGVIDTVFGRVLLQITEIRDHNTLKLIPFLPVAGVVIILLYRKYGKECVKGMTLIFETGQGEREKIPRMLIPLSILGTWITHLFGGSAGREGVAVQLGATIAHAIGRRIKLPNNSRVLLIAGMAAGFAG
ncbi:MAG: chloride channel protein, partial [Mobilitalea sp.]